jgi:hypothetical protein
MNRPDDYEPGNEADDLVEWVAELGEAHDRNERVIALYRAQVLATLQVARELKRARESLDGLTKATYTAAGP